MLVVATLTGCSSPGSHVVGKTFTSIDEHTGTEVDSVPCVYTYDDGIRRMWLGRVKESDGTIRYVVDVTISFTMAIDIRQVAFELDGKRVVLDGASSIADVDARTYDVFYIMKGTYGITEAQIREITAAERVVFIAMVPVEWPLELGPNARRAIAVFQATFVDQDGIGEKVTKTKVEQSW